MTHHENQAIRFLKAQQERLEEDLADLQTRENELHQSLEANAATQAEKQSALNDINQLLDHISS